jgi:hypothetical protein
MRVSVTLRVGGEHDGGGGSDRKLGEKHDAYNDGEITRARDDGNR